LSINIAYKQGYLTLTKIEPTIEVSDGQIPRVVSDLKNNSNYSMSKSRTTSPKAAKAASRVLRNGSTSKDSKTAAGSALSQRAPKKGAAPRVK
jgi:hypothetical protein